ncbi:TPA: hypothetical protein EYP45_01260, partial [Candidatus Peregrinibacteria bacterium]|nr:hypothetical protein [Candidatus Peregrinibacteria bacterium]
MKKLHINSYRNLSLKIKTSILSIFSVCALSIFVFNTSENGENNNDIRLATVVAGGACNLDG